MAISLCLTPVGKIFYEKLSVKANAFVPMSFDDNTGTQYAIWLANLKFVFWVQERNENLLCNSQVYHEHGCKFNVQMQRI